MITKTEVVMGFSLRFYFFVIVVVCHLVQATFKKLDFIFAKCKGSKEMAMFINKLWFYCQFVLVSMVPLCFSVQYFICSLPLSGIPSL